jgi:uncharacterized protein YjbI with pentapeptide repeats
MITKEQVLNNLDEVKKYIAEAETKKEDKVVGIAIKSVLGSIRFQSTKTTYKEAVVEAIASDSDLRGANLRGADLSDSDLSDANLRDSDLSGADLSGANLRGADLSGANLRGADLSDANLRDSDLSDANLRDSDLSGADLSGANLRGADLSDAELNCAKFYGRGGTKTLKRSQLPSFLGALGFIIEDYK